MWRRCSRLAVAGSLGLLVACAPLSVPQERALGEQANLEARSQLPLVQDAVIWDYVRTLGHRLVAAAGPQPFTFHFYVVREDEINAFALPAGYIYVNTGTILRARDVSELAGVMGHEVGHVVRRHVAENYSRQQGVGALYRIGVYTAALLGGGAAASAANLGGSLAAMAYLNSFGREAEREADAFAVEVLPRAGYDPEGLVTFFETLMRESPGGVPAFLSSHPTTSERIANTRSTIEAARLPAGLSRSDGGRLEAVQRRIRRLR